MLVWNAMLFAEGYIILKLGVGKWEVHCTVAKISVAPLDDMKGKA